MPIEPMLSAAAAELPQPSTLNGGCWYEPKFDGYRALVFVAEAGVRVQSRNGHDITTCIPDIASAALDQVPAGTVLDGELVVWTEQPDFSALQRRLVHRRDARALAEREPANLMVFDVLAVAGEDATGRKFADRRACLEQLGNDLTPPLQVVPGTADVDLARGWLEDYARADVGIEGLVIKGLHTAYQAGQRGWLKYKLRDTAEAVVGAVIGSCEEPRRLVLGRFDEHGTLRIAGSTGELRPHHRDEVRAHLVTAAEHPWPIEISSGGLGHWRGGLQVIHRVEPTLVVEVSADRAFEHGRWRHLTRYVRVRTDLDVSALH